ncbi:hypothetical protein Asp14428_26940 [Actinoplanes sp. NBRC 14428]|nr:hypothetical protein Asp14428_26940 [Actinoplanes sp. NBRC 14428]
MTRPSRLARYGFADNGARAADLLGPGGLRLWNPEAQEPVDPEAGELLQALSRAADPTLALRQLHRLVDAASRAALRGNGGPVTGPGEEIAAGPAAEAILTALAGDAGLRRRLIAVLGASSALGDHLVANHDQWRVLVTGKTGLPPNAEGRLEFGDSTGEGPPTVAALRAAYRIALLRIVAADLTGGAGWSRRWPPCPGWPTRPWRRRMRSPSPAFPRAPRSRGWRSSRWASAAVASSTTCPTWTSSSWPPATRTCPPAPPSRRS